jgi:CBS domain-containing protein
MAATTMTRAPARTLVKGDLTFVRDDETVRDAAERLAFENIGALPVYDRNNNLKGMITDRDITVDVVARGRDPSRTLVGEVAHTNPITVRAEDSVADAMRLMAQHKVRRLPVIDGRSCIGVISQADIARAVPPEETGRLVEFISTD